MNSTKSVGVAVLAAVPLLGAALVGIGPAQADTVTRSIVVNSGDGRVCNDGYGNQTTDISYVRTKSGSVKWSCHFRTGTTNWAPGTKINVFTFGDCAVDDFNGNTINLNSKFVVNKNGSANMTCN